MTEAEWHAAKSPLPLFEYLGRRAGARKRRLFACACYRRICDRSGRASVPELLLLGERYADREVPAAELIAAGSRLGARGGYSAAWAENNALHAVLEPSPREIAEHAAQCTAAHAAFSAEEQRINDGQGEPERNAGHGARDTENQALAALVHDLFGNPFRPVACDPSWLTEPVVALASSIYADRAFDRLPILADAIEDAGCASADVLTHLRGPGPHSRGCWAVDLLLGKT